MSLRLRWWFAATLVVAFVGCDSSGETATETTEEAAEAGDTDRDGGVDATTSASVYDGGDEPDATATPVEPPVECAGTLDECGVCNGPGIPEGLCDCDGNVADLCGVCGGDNECLDCAGEPNGPALPDECGVCDGPGIAEGACDCDGNVLDRCGECGGDGSSCHELQGRYAVRTVGFGRQISELTIGGELDLVSKAIIYSTVDIDAAGVVTEHHCFVETTSDLQVASWSTPAASETIPDGVATLVDDGNGRWVRRGQDDTAYIGWDPVLLPEDCVTGETHGSGCFCGDPDVAPTNAQDCRVFDMEGDGLPGATLNVTIMGQPVDVVNTPPEVIFNMANVKSMEWVITPAADGNHIGTIEGGVEQSELEGTRSGGNAGLFTRVFNSVCPDAGHVEFIAVGADFTCADIMAGRAEDVAGHGLFDASLDDTLTIDQCPHPKCPEGGEPDECGVCNGPGPSIWYADEDGDGLGGPDPIEGCEPPEGTVSNSDDECPLDPTNFDDGDPLCADVDNCPFNANGGQLDTDGDGVGDICDDCPYDALDDGDGDGLCADVDNCPGVSNAGQQDRDSDGVGDVCDACGDDPDNDIDTDGVCGDVDNCPNDTNGNQADANGDGEGDVCDPCPNDAFEFTDGDGVCADVDNCPYNANLNQFDTDNDGVGDACDACMTDPNNDVDGDGICGDVDNCPGDANPGQEDSNNNGIGDACDGCADSDGDGACNDTDNCPSTANVDQVDADNDGAGDACDPCPNDPEDDADNDNVCGDVDNCPFNGNGGQLDTDSDGQGDICDVCPRDRDNDIDGDGACADVDNCPTANNPNQADADSDGLGDACDACPNDADNDTDGDGVCGDVDNCPSDPNENQADSDGNGLGDACDGGSGTNPLPGTYMVRSVIWGRQDGADESKAIGYSVVTITGNGTRLTMRDDSCWAYTEPQNSGGWNTWQRADWAMAINDAVPVERTLSDRGDGTWLREAEVAAIGFDPAACTGNCTCPNGLPPYRDGAPNHCSLVDHDNSGHLGIAAWGDTGRPTSINDNGGTALVHVASLVANHWIVTPSPDRFHTGVVGDGDINGANPSRQMIVGCTNFFFCGSLNPRANQPCPREYNSVQFVPVDEGFTCTDMLSTYSFSDLYNNPSALGFDTTLDGDMPSEAVCPHPPAP